MGRMKNRSSKQTECTQDTNSSQQNTLKCKVVLVGGISSGKTNMALRFAKDMFHDEHVSTIGALFMTKDIQVDGQTIHYEIWDTAGEERFRSLAPIFYRRAQAAVVVYDITQKKSFQAAKAWVTELRQADSQPVILLAGNKADLETERMVRHEEAQKYAQEENLLFLETSAKTGHHIEEVFQEIGVHLPREAAAERNDQNIVDMSKPKKKKKWCKRLF